MLEGLSRKMRSKCLENLLNTGDLTLINKSIQKLKGKLDAAQGLMQSKELRMIVKNTEIFRKEKTRKVTNEGKFKVQVVIPSSPSFASGSCIRDVMVLGSKQKDAFKCMA